MSSDESIEQSARARAVRDKFTHIWRSDHPLANWAKELPKIRDLNDHRLVDMSDRGVGWAELDPEPIEWTPGPARSGSCFEIESTEMREACVEPIRYHLGADLEIHEARHQRAGYHTDLVYAVINNDKLKERQRLIVGSDPIHDPLQRFRVWWYAHENGPIPKQKLIDDGRYADPKKNRKHVSWLLDHGYLARSRTGHVVAVIPPKIADLHAVELKLRDWKTALDQAARANRDDSDEDWRPLSRRKRYGYADYRWVALDAGAVHRALDNIDSFKERGVGLLGVAEGGAVVEHLGAAHEPREPYTRDRAYIESQVWSRSAGETDIEGSQEEGASQEESSQPQLTTFGDQ